MTLSRLRPLALLVLALAALAAVAAACVVAWQRAGAQRLELQVIAPPVMTPGFGYGVQVRVSDADGPVEVETSIVDADEPGVRPLALAGGQSDASGVGYVEGKVPLWTPRRTLIEVRARRGLDVATVRLAPLVRDDLGRLLVVAAERSDLRSGEPIQVRVQVSSAALEPVADVEVVLTLLAPTGFIVGRWSGFTSEQGEYAATFPTERGAPSGSYQILAAVGHARGRQVVRLENSLDPAPEPVDARVVAAAAAPRLELERPVLASNDTLRAQVESGEPVFFSILRDGAPLHSRLVTAPSARLEIGLSARFVGTLTVMACKQASDDSGKPPCATRVAHVLAPGDAERARLTGFDPLAMAASVAARVPLAEALTVAGQASLLTRQRELFAGKPELVEPLFASSRHAAARRQQSATAARASFVLWLGLPVALCALALALVARTRPRATFPSAALALAGLLSSLWSLRNGWAEPGHEVPLGWIEQNSADAEVLEAQRAATTSPFARPARETFWLPPTLTQGDELSVSLPHPVSSVEATPGLQVGLGNEGTPTLTIKALRPGREWLTLHADGRGGAQRFEIHVLQAGFTVSRDAVATANVRFEVPQDAEPGTAALEACVSAPQHWPSAFAQQKTEPFLELGGLFQSTLLPSELLTQRVERRTSPREPLNAEQATAKELGQRGLQLFQRLLAADGGVADVPAGPSSVEASALALAWHHELRAGHGDHDLRAQLRRYLLERSSANDDEGTKVLVRWSLAFTRKASWSSAHEVPVHDSLSKALLANVLLSEGNTSAAAPLLDELSRLGPGPELPTAVALFAAQALFRATRAVDRGEALVGDALSRVGVGELEPLAALGLLGALRQRVVAVRETGSAALRLDEAPARPLTFAGAAPSCQAFPALASGQHELALRGAPLVANVHLEYRSSAREVRSGACDASLTVDFDWTPSGGLQATINVASAEARPAVLLLGLPPGTELETEHLSAKLAAAGATLVAQGPTALLSFPELRGSRRLELPLRVLARGRVQAPPSKLRLARRCEIAIAPVLVELRAAAR